MKPAKPIHWAPGHPDSRGVADLWLPQDARHAPSGILLIHGGGWQGMDRHSFDGVADWAVHDLRLPAFNTNYRLIRHAPWPACREDCLAAAKAFLELLKARTKHPKILIAGASAGGHLALQTALILSAKEVAGIIALAPPLGPGVEPILTPGLRSPQFYRKFCGEATRSAVLRDADIRTYLRSDAPPLFICHWPEDTVVHVEHSRRLVTAWKSLGRPVCAYFFDSPHEGHGIWRNPEGSPRRLLPAIEREIRLWVDSL